MRKMDIEKFKKAIAALKTPQPGGRARTTPDPRVIRRQQQLDKIAKTFLQRTGVDQKMLAEVTTRRETAPKPLTNAERTALAKRGAAAERQFQAQLRSRHETLIGLAHPPAVPFTPYYIYLEKPFLIWELPHPQLNLLHWTVAPGSSSVRVDVEFTSGSDLTYFAFYYLWENEGDVPAVVNVYTGLTFNGGCQLSAAGGVFSSDACFLNISASLTPYEWWNVPATMPLPQSTQTVPVLNLSVSGPTFPEYLWQNAETTSQRLEYFPANMQYTQFRVPPRSTAVFEVSAVFSFGFTSGGLNLSDLISANFSNPDLNYKIVSPMIALEVLQGPAAQPLTTAAARRR
jgi:hypothetical protein